MGGHVSQISRGLRPKRREQPVVSDATNL